MHLSCKAPGSIPVEAFAIQEEAHKLGNSYGRMCVVHLEHCAFWQQSPIVAMPRLEASQHVLRASARLVCRGRSSQRALCDCHRIAVWNQGYS